jgi:FdhE protein
MSGDVPLQCPHRCATHWYVPRLTCTKCGSTANLVYFAVEGDENKIKAEACNRSHTYLKLFYLENNPEAEAFTDGLATLALDLLISDKSYHRSGINLFLLRK